MTNLTIALAQFSPVKGNVAHNVSQHLQLVNDAITKNADIIVFPELSLTGYEPELAKALAFNANDVSLKPFDVLAKEHSITIIVGAPIKLAETKPYIGEFIISAPSDPIYYCKMHFHTGEDEYFSKGSEYCLIDVKGIKLGLAICADTSVESHIREVKLQGAEYYICSSLITASGYEHDITQLQGYAKKYAIGVTVSNFVNESGGFQTTGKSTIINKLGEIISVASDSDICIITSTIVA